MVGGKKKRHEADKLGKEEEETPPPWATSKVNPES